MEHSIRRCCLFKMWDRVQTMDRHPAIRPHTVRCKSHRTERGQVGTEGGLMPNPRSAHGCRR
jgi:hypothetical protein